MHNRNLMKTIIITILIFALALVGCSQSNKEAASPNNQKAENTTSEKPDNDSSASDQAKDNYPEKPITWIVASAAGDPGDVTARLLAQYAEKYLPNNAKFVFVNKPGAAGTLGATSIYEAEPDGYTVSMNAMAAMTIQPALGKTKYAHDGLQAIINYVDAPQLIFVPWDAPYKNLDEWLEYVKKNPGKVKYGVSGKLNAQEIAMEQMAQKVGLKMEAVAYKGEPDELNALLRGDIPVAVLNGANSYQYFESKKIRPLVNITGVKPPFNDVPTLKESGIDMEATFFNGVFTTKGTPENRVNILYDAFKKALDDPGLKQEFEKRELVSNPKGPKEFQDMITELYNEYSVVLKNMGAIK